MIFTTELPIVGKNNRENNPPINIDHILMLDSIAIPTGLTSGDGDTPLVKTGTGIVLSNGMILPCRLSKEEVLVILKNAKV